MRLLSVRQAAEMTGMAEVTVRTWLAQRRLERVKLGRSVRIPLDAILRKIAEGTTPEE